MDKINVFGKEQQMCEEFWYDFETTENSTTFKFQLEKWQLGLSQQ